MSEPIMQSPLHAFGLASQAVAMDDSRGVWANEISGLAYINLRGNALDSAFTDKIATATGVTLPVQPCTFAMASGVKILWISPDEWMIVSSRHRLGALKDGLQSALQGIRSQVVDNSGGYTQVLLSGRNTLDVLQHASVYDFAAMPAGRVVGTTFGKSSVYAHRAAAGFCLLMRRSFADYIWRYLVRAAEPYGFGVATIDTAAHARREAE
jgi:sarcosine oxidase, subunit gamma